MRSVAYRLVIILAALLMCSVLFFALDVRRDVMTLMERRKQIRDLQRENASLALEIQKKRERIEMLRGNRTQQELEIRERQKLLRRGETTFLLQDGKKNK